MQPGEKIQAIIDTRDFAGERFLFFATRQGTVKKTAFDAYDSSRRDGLIALNLRGGDELVRVIETGGGDDIFMVSRKGMTIRFNEDDVRPMGRTAAGVRGMKLRAGDEVVSVDVARDDTAILMVTEAGYGKRTQLDQYNAQGRGGQGVIGIKLTGRKGEVVAAFMVGLDDEIVAVSSSGDHDPHAGPRDLLAGPRRHRRAGDEPRRRPDRRLGRPDPVQRRRLTLGARRPAPPSTGRRRVRRPRPRRCGVGVRAAMRDDAGRPCRWPRRWWRSPPCWCSAIGALAGDVVDAGRARSAADAAALAGVDGGRPASAAPRRRATGRRSSRWRRDGRRRGRHRARCGDGDGRATGSGDAADAGRAR